MTSVTDVCNLALSFVGKPEISSLDEQSTAAGWCRRGYPIARRDALAKNDWIFARAYARLVATEDPFHPDYGRTFARPADAVIIRAVGTGDSPYRRGAPWHALDYDVIGDSVMTRSGAQSPVIWYTRDVLDPDRWVSGFAEAVAYKLAALIAPQATGRPADAVQLAQLYSIKWREAAQDDAAQERATWTTDQEMGIRGGGDALTAAEFARLVDFPWDETMIWGKTGTPVSVGGGGPPPPPHIDTLDDGISDFVALYEAEKDQ